MPERLHHAARLHYKAGLSAFIVLLYVALYQLSGLLSGNEAFGGVASIFFLPAFVRLLGFLTLGYAVIPALFVAALFCVDLGLGIQDRVVIAAFLACGAPLAIAAASQWLDLKPSLSNLTPLRLLWLSIASALGNAIFSHIGLEAVGLATSGWQSQIVIFLGDAMGTWGAILAVKGLLTLYGRLSGI